MAFHFRAHGIQCSWRWQHQVGRHDEPWIPLVGQQMQIHDSEFHLSPNIKLEFKGSQVLWCIPNSGRRSKLMGVGVPAIGDPQKRYGSRLLLANYHSVWGAVVASSKEDLVENPMIWQYLCKTTCWLSEVVACAHMMSTSGIFQQLGLPY